jgi:hypothetical protein
MTGLARDSRQFGFEGPFSFIVKDIFKSGKSRKPDGHVLEWPITLASPGQAAQILFLKNSRARR